LPRNRTDKPQGVDAVSMPFFIARATGLRKISPAAKFFLLYGGTSAETIWAAFAAHVRPLA